MKVAVWRRAGRKTHRRSRKVMRLLPEYKAGISNSVAHGAPSLG